MAQPFAAESSATHVGSAAPVLAHEGDTVGAVRERLRRHGRQDWHLVCAVDAHGRLLGTLTAPQLLALPDEAHVVDAARAELPRVHPDMDQEHMASLALEHGAAALPVVDADGRLLGVVGPQAMMRVLRREHVEDLHVLAGITRETDQARAAIEAPPLRRVRDRLPWLLVGVAGCAAATALMARFESSLAATPALAFFVPGLVYLADAIGTQAEAVAVRGLSLSRMPLRHLLAGEIRTGWLIGLLLALGFFPLIWWVFGDMRLAAAVALSLACASILASVLGLLLPWVLARLGKDPAYGSGPLATIVQDVASLLIYFGFATALVTAR